MKGSLEDIRRDFQDLCRYCANDVGATKKVYEKLLPMFFERYNRRNRQSRIFISNLKTCMMFDPFFLILV